MHVTAVCIRGVVFFVNCSSKRQQLTNHLSAPMVLVLVDLVHSLRLEGGGWWTFISWFLAPIATQPNEATSTTTTATATVTFPERVWLRKASGMSALRCPDVNILSISDPTARVEKGWARIDSIVCFDHFVNGKKRVYPAGISRTNTWFQRYWILFALRSLRLGKYSVLRSASSEYLTCIQVLVCQLISTTSLYLPIFCKLDCLKDTNYYLFLDRTDSVETVNPPSQTTRNE